MAAAALVVSILAICVSLVSARASRRSARAAEDTQHRARTPQLKSSVAPAAGGGYVLRLRNGGPTNLDHLLVELVPSRQPQEPMSVGAISPDSGLGTMEPAQVADLGALPLGESRDVRLWNAGARARGTFYVRCKCRRGEERWDVLVEEELPPESGLIV